MDVVLNMYSDVIVCERLRLPVVFYIVPWLSCWTGLGHVRTMDEVLNMYCGRLLHAVAISCNGTEQISCCYKLLLLLLWLEKFITTSGKPLVPLYDESERVPQHSFINYFMQDIATARLIQSGNNC